MSHEIEDTPVFHKPAPSGPSTETIHNLFFDEFYLQIKSLQAEGTFTNGIIAKVIRDTFKKLTKQGIRIDGTHVFANREIREMYVDRGLVGTNRQFEEAIKINPVRSASGVLSVSLMLDGSVTSCGYNCHYCPNEPGQARSYLSNESVPMLGDSEGHVMIMQALRRLVILAAQGHPIDKMEILLLGGTWHSFPEGYRRQAIHDVYYACNVFSKLFGVNGVYEKEAKLFAKSALTSRLSDYVALDAIVRDFPKGTFAEEKIKNTNAVNSRIISIVLETRPDELKTKESLLELRELGCTRVQIGVQSMNDNVLRCNNRGHTALDTTIALQRLLNAGFKIDIHIMPDLPGSTVNTDKDTIAEIFTSTQFTFDQIKIYPCMDLPFTEIRRWHNRAKELLYEGKLEELSLIEHAMNTGGMIPNNKKVWRPRSEYAFLKLVDTLKFALEHTPSHVRINRVLRDFQKASDKNGRLGYESDNLYSNLRELLEKQQDTYDIRAREVSMNCPSNFTETMQIIVTQFRAGSGTEHFISMECPKESPKSPRDTILLGLLRLRILDDNSPSDFFDTKIRTAIIREVHVYGIMTPESNQAALGEVQHFGIGKQLMAKAESIATEAGCEQIFIISGVGVMNYYKKLGYTDYNPGEYLMRAVPAMGAVPAPITPQPAQVPATAVPVDECENGNFGRFDLTQKNAIIEDCD